MKLRFAMQYNYYTSGYYVVMTTLMRICAIVWVLNLNDIRCLFISIVGMFHFTPRFQFVAIETHL